jgi:hypothetical protein
MFWFSIFTSLISTRCVLLVCCFHTLVFVVVCCFHILVFVVQSIILFRALVMLSPFRFNFEDVRSIWEDRGCGKQTNSWGYM